MWGWLVQAASDRGSSPAGQGGGRGRPVKGGRPGWGGALPADAQGTDPGTPDTVHTFLWVTCQRWGVALQCGGREGFFEGLRPSTSNNVCL